MTDPTSEPDQPDQPDQPSAPEAAQDADRQTDEGDVDRAPEGAEPKASVSDDSEIEWCLLDAAAYHEAHPDGFPIPALTERSELRSGDMVKLVFVLDPPPASGPNAERMWVEVALAHPDGSCEGWLTNQPVVIPSLRPSTIIGFEPRHVAGIALHEQDLTFDVALRAVISARALQLDGPPGWVGRDEPVDKDDSGWSVTAGDEPEDYFDDEQLSTAQALSLGELAGRYPALVEVFQAGEGEWVYRPDHRRYVRLKNS